MTVWVPVCVLTAFLTVAACGRADAVPGAADNARLEPGDVTPNKRSDLPLGVTQVQAVGVVINGHPLAPQELAQLGARIPPGDYWYDAVAGFWGYMGGSVEGQVAPGYRIGALRQDASSGNTGTIINGREITTAEAVWLSRQVPVQRGRFWMNPDGVFGYEGGPALGQIALGGQSSGGGDRPSLSERGLLFRPGEILNGR